MYGVAPCLLSSTSEEDSEFNCRLLKSLSEAEVVIESLYVN